MNKTEFEVFQREVCAPTAVKGSDLADQAPRTLVYGYTPKRNTFHVYLDDKGVLNLVVYDSDGFLVEHGVEDELVRFDYAPGKRAYPERCDLEFCRLLKRAEVDLSFTNFDDRVDPNQLWHGERKENLIEVRPADRLPMPLLRVSVADLGIEEQVLYVSSLAVMDLENGLTQMLYDVFGRLHLLRKFKGVDDTAKWLKALPDNVEWHVRNWAENWQQDGLLEYRMPPELLEKLRQKITDLLTAKA